MKKVGWSKFLEYNGGVEVLKNWEERGVKVVFK